LLGHPAPGHCFVTAACNGRPLFVTAACNGRPLPVTAAS